MPLEPTIFMKTKGLTQSSRNFGEIVCYSIQKAYFNGFGSGEKNKKNSVEPTMLLKKKVAKN
jgi:hypothetical protein